MAEAESQAFYDSDEEVSWGPLTLKEIKTRLINKNIRPISVRYSTSSIPEPIIKMEDSIPEISDYLTASEQLQDETCLNFIKKAFVNTTDDLIESEYHSLVENNSVISLSSDDEMEKTAKDLSDDYTEEKKIFGESSSFSDKDNSKEEEIFDVPSICFENNSTIDTDNESINISTPDIDFNQFNDSNESIFNNTLERINAILKLTEEQEENTTSEKLFLPNKTPKKSNIPVLKKSPEMFKVPELSHKKLTNTKINLKNIVSPVRMYIKYSPQAVLKKNIHCENTQKLKVTTQNCLENKFKENIADIPNNIAYKPARKQMLATEEKFNFPASLDKMIKKSTIIKHERLPTIKNDKTLNHEADLTSCDVDNNESNLCDVSVLYKKNALK